MLKSEKINNRAVVSFDIITRLNAVIAEPVKEELKSYLNEPHSKLILNLEGVKFIDSTGFSVFLSIKKAASNNNCQFKICNVSQDIMKLFDLLQLNYVFEIYNSLDECLKSFK